MSDQLSAATRALRLTRTGTSPTAGTTEERVVARVTRQSRRTRRSHWLLPIAAVLAVSSAWAATQPDVQRGARALWHRLTAPAPSVEAGVRSASPASTEAAAATLATSAAPPALDPREAPPAAPQPLNAPAMNAKRSLGKPGAPAPLPQPSATPPVGVATSLQLYQRAHELHFRKQDFATALTAWNEYLASSAVGPLALEARYNRAICLTRLGRNAEARAALLPFARGDYGGYRQTEANALMNGHGSPEP